jgi:hypothetical protein
MGFTQMEYIIGAGYMKNSGQFIVPEHFVIEPIKLQRDTNQGNCNVNPGFRKQVFQGFHYGSIRF